MCTSEPQTPKRNPFKILGRQAKTTKLRNFECMRGDYNEIKWSSHADIYPKRMWKRSWVFEDSLIIHMDFSMMYYYEEIFSCLRVLKFSFESAKIVIAQSAHVAGNQNLSKKYF